MTLIEAIILPIKKKDDVKILIRRKKIIKKKIKKRFIISRNFFKISYPWSVLLEVYHGRSVPLEIKHIRHLSLRNYQQSTRNDQKIELGKYYEDRIHIGRTHTLSKSIEGITIGTDYCKNEKNKIYLSIYLSIDRSIHPFIYPSKIILIYKTDKKKQKRSCTGN